MERFLLTIPRSLRFFFLLLCTLLATYLLSQIFFSQRPTVPAKFLEANREGVVIAQKIVTLSKESSERIATIGQLEKDDKVAEAVDLVEQELGRNKEMRDDAMMLSAQLQAMTESLPDMKPEKVRLDALQAISIEVSLTNRLFDYNDYLNQLLGVLKDKFLYNITPAIGRIDYLITQINEEAKQINQLNSQFNQQIEAILAK